VAPGLQELAEAHPAVGDLTRLVEALERRDRLPIGTDRAQHAAALLARLSARGIRLDTPQAALSWLAPVLCVTARDRAALAARLRPADAPPPEPLPLAPLPGEAAQEKAAAAAKRRVWPALLVGALMLAFAVAGFMGGGEAPAAARATPAPAGTLALPPWLLAALIMAVLGATFGWLVGRVLRPDPRVALPLPDPLPRGQGLDWFDGGTLYGPLRQMGRERRPASRRLDLVATVAETVRNAGWPKLVRGGRPRLPEHLLLVQVASPDDPQRIAAAALVARLRAAGLRVAAFVFQGQPAKLRRLEGGPALSFARVAAGHAESRLLLVSDGGSLWDPLAGTVPPDPRFDGFPVRILVTPRPRPAWGRQEATLDRAGWRLAELSTAGIADLGRWLSGTREALPPLASAPVAPDLAELLGRDPRLASEEPPEPALRARLLQRLALFLDEDPRAPPHGFELLSALAIGARLPPGTVERVAAHLALLDGPAPPEAVLRRLLRLPWLAAGRMPLWLREDLLRGLAEPRRGEARQAWLLHLADREPLPGLPRHDAGGRLAAEARRRLAAPTPLADALMRRTLDIEPQAAPWQAKGVLDAALGAAVVVVLGAAQGETLLRGAAALLGLVFAPLEAVAGGAGLDIAAGLALGLAAGRVARWRWVDPARAAGALYLGLGVLWLATDLGDKRILPPALPLAVCALALLAWTRLAPRGGAPRPVWRPVPDRAWAMAAAVGLSLALALAMALTSEIAEGIGSLLALMAALVAGLAAGLGVALWRIGLAGPPDWRSVLRLGAATAGLHALVLLVGALIPGNETVAGSARWLALAGPLPVALLLVLRPRLATARLFGASACLLGFPVAAAATMNGTGAPQELGFAFLSVPVLMAAVAVLVARRCVGLRWAWLAALVLGLVGLRMGVFVLPDLDTGKGALLFWFEWLMLWPLLRLLRPDLVAPSDGLWRRCLAFLPCWIGLPVTAGWALGPIPLLALPVAGWIAARHGPRALPAIAVALLPMAIGWRGEVWGVPLSVGGGLGTSLAAMLVAAFVAARGFREACLAATRLTRWQMAALAVLPFGLAVPNLGGFQFAFHGHVLVLTVAALIGLSQVPLRAPLLVLCGSGLFGAAVALATGLPGEGWGGSSHALRNLPGDLVSVLLALSLFRLLRGAPRPALTPGLGIWPAAALPGPREVTRAGAWLLRALNAAPAPVLLVAAVSAWILVVTLSGSLLDPDDITTTLRPFLPVHIHMLALAVAAAGAAQRIRLGLPGAAAGWPWVPTIAAATMAAAMAVPDLRILIGPLELGIGGLMPGDFVAGLVAVWFSHRMGLALPALLAAAPLPAPGLVHPVFALWPLRIGLGCAALAALAMVVFVVFAMIEFGFSGMLRNVDPFSNPAPALDPVPASPPPGAGLPRS